MSNRVIGLLAAGIFTLLTAPPPPAAAQVVQGLLIDEASQDAIEGAALLLVHADGPVVIAATVTDSAGYFLLDAGMAGDFRLRAERIGYPTTISTPLGVGVGDTIEVEFRLSAGAVLLDPVVVTARRRRPPPLIRDFYRRAERSVFGTFITRAEVEEIHPFRTSDLLRRIPGVQIVPAGFGGGSTILMRGGCRALVVVDGVRLGPIGSIDDLVQPLELEGIEVYRSSSHVPIEYGGLRGECGAVMIWTRRGP